MPDVRAVWRSSLFEAVVGRAYNFGVEHAWVARPAGRVLFGTDTRLIYDAMAGVGALPDGSAVLDVPCGGGVVLDGLRAAQRVRYVAADISPTMLDRARRRAARLGSASVSFVEADIERMPFRDGEFDLCVCFNGLHCLPDPAAAVREIARCLKPGGRLVGDCAVRGERRRADAWIALLRAAGMFGPTGTVFQLRRWLVGAGLRVVSLRCSGAITHFVAERPRAGS